MCAHMCVQVGMETDGGPGLGWHDDTAGTSEYPMDGGCIEKKIKIYAKEDDPIGGVYIGIVSVLLAVCLARVCEGSIPAGVG